MLEQIAPFAIVGVGTGSGEVIQGVWTAIRVSLFLSGLIARRHVKTPLEDLRINGFLVLAAADHKPLDVWILVGRVCQTERVADNRNVSPRKFGHWNLFAGDGIHEIQPDSVIGHASEHLARQIGRESLLHRPRGVRPVRVGPEEIDLLDGRKIPVRTEGIE